ncbi:ankyrin repeat domain-containing protein 45 [Mastacembelus armatus]|uniref:ankyrin repeat domain-containing protein 45 n=1 Tax=Mastacembelus armatus TaxID=205130 RepID=UPI000E462457|nr:ankyrin repeat domain-containing protein 45 [Mastacembelus armatus]
MWAQFDTVFPGCSPLHLAACWGHLETVRTLLELEADIKAKTFRGERPVDMARRYSKTDCVNCLIMADSAQNMCMRVCSAKSDWIQSVKNPKVSDFIAQRKETEETLQPILSKLSAQCISEFMFECKHSSM